MKHRLLIVSRNQQAFKEKVVQLGLPDLEILAPEHRTEIADYITDVDIILGVPRFVKPHLAQAKKLRWFQSIFAGIEVLAEDDVRQDYTLTNVKDTYGEVMGEFVFAYILGLERDLFLYHQKQREKQWDQKAFQSITGKKIAILGAGSIGTEIAARAKAFGLITYGLRREQKPAEYFDKIYIQSELDECLSDADYIVSVLPNTKDTDNLIDAAALAKCKPEAIFINIGRSNAVDEGAVVDALQNKRLRAAVLDVFDTEPLPAESPLWSVPNLYITPHVSGYTISDRIMEIFAENYELYRQGKALNYQIDFTKGY